MCRPSLDASGAELFSSRSNCLASSKSFCSCSLMTAILLRFCSNEVFSIICFFARVQENALFAFLLSDFFFAMMIDREISNVIYSVNTRKTNSAVIPKSVYTRSFFCLLFLNNTNYLRCSFELMQVWAFRLPWIESNWPLHGPWIRRGKKAN